MDKINDQIPESQLLNKIDGLTTLLKSDIEKAYQSNTSIKEFYTNLDEFDLNMLQ